MTSRSANRRPTSLLFAALTMYLTAIALTATAIGTFARGLRKDWDAVVNGMSLPYSSGVVEGHASRLKVLKRQMFGRAGFSLLR